VVNQRTPPPSQPLVFQRRERRRGHHGHL
jgi:hypothetical protein